MKYNFKFSLKDYSNPCSGLFCEDECDYLVDYILDKSNGYICDAIWEIADEAVDIYYSELEKALQNPSLIPYIVRAIEEYEIKPEGDGYQFIMKSIQCGEFLFYEESLYNNIDTIAGNALRSYVNSTTFASTKSYNPDEIKNFIEDYIACVSIDTNDTIDSILENFETELFSAFDIEIVH